MALPFILTGAPTPWDVASRNVNEVVVAVEPITSIAGGAPFFIQYIIVQF
jgi:hypothetical protein